jgi:hypothetical protein
MAGSECARFCTSCGLNVYNLSAMTREEAEALILQKEGRLCVRFFQRDDGTVMTTDCPVGVRAWYVRLRVVVAFAATLLLLALGLTGRSAPGRRNDSWIMKIEPIRTIVEWIQPPGKPPTNPPCIMGKMDDRAFQQQNPQVQ